MGFANPKYSKKKKKENDPYLTTLATETEVVEVSIVLWWEKKYFAFPGERLSAADEHLMVCLKKSTESQGTWQRYLVLAG